MSHGQPEDFDDWADEVGTTDDPRQYDDYDANWDYPSHLTIDPDVRIAPNLKVDKDDGLFYCTECELRITRNSHNHNEYGHARSCSHHQTFSGVER